MLGYMTDAEAAYNAYCEDRGWKTVRGDQLPKFLQQLPDLQIAWSKAADAAINNYLRRLYDQRTQGKYQS